MTFDAPTINTTFQDKFGTLQLRMADSVAITVILKNCAFLENYLRTDLDLIVEGSEFALKSCVYLWCMQCHVN